MKNKFKLMFIAGILGGTGLSAQRSVDLDNYVALFPDPSWSFYANPLWQYWDEWQPGGKYEPGHFTEDDNFFIARTRMNKRFYNSKTQVDPNMKAENGRNVFWWQPISNGDKAWMGHPRYSMKNDNFSMWQYLKTHGNWNQEFFRVDGCFSDACFKNGVRNGVLMFMDQAEGGGVINYESPGSNKHGRILQTLMRKDDQGNFTEVEKLIKILRYYGISGLTFNPEASMTSNTARTLQDFLLACRKEAEKQGWGDHWYVGWYDGMTNTGGHSFGGNALTNDRVDWFRHPVETEQAIVDHWFLNYNHYENQVKGSATMAKSLGRNPYEVYAGQHIGGRGLGTNWSNIEKYEVSVGTWGEHGSNNIFGSCRGDSPMEFSKDYLNKLEMFFSGGNLNPAKCPTQWTSDRAAISDENLKQFPGMAKMMPAQSVLSELPFVTRFSLGNGANLYIDGKIANGFSWYNIGMQDYLPTWRWWITDASGNVPEKSIKCELSFEDAYSGGSALKLQGATPYSHIRLFKTKFAADPTYNSSLTYKVVNGQDPKFKLVYSLEGSENIFHQVEVSPVVEAGKWHTVNWNLSDWGLKSGDVIATLGILAENTADNYEAYIGEFSILTNKQYNPVTPKIRPNFKQYLDKSGYDFVTFKMIWDSKINEDKWEVVYNEDVDTWYFEILLQDKNGLRVVNTTTSWAAMTVAQLDMSSPEVKIGVRAVAPDGKTRSEIAWADAKLDMFYEYLTDIKFTAPNKLTTDDEFTVELVDKTIPEAHWKLLDQNNQVIKEFDGISFTTKVAEIGVYSVEVSFDRPTKEDPNAVYTKLHGGLISVTPTTTGQVPVANFTASATDLMLTDKPVDVTFQFTGRKGEGTSSNAINLDNKNYIGVDHNILSDKQTMSMAAWVRNTVVQSDMIMNYRQTSGNPSWGCWWLHNCEGGKVTLGWRNGITGSDGKEISDFVLQKGTWYHIAVTFDKPNKSIKVYVNGNKVIDAVGTLRTTEQAFCWGSGDCYADVDECQIWNRPLTEAEVKEAMFGYAGKDIPEGLVGYWDMESIENRNLPNLGSAKAYTASLYKDVNMSEAKKTDPQFVPSTSWLPGSTPILTTLNWEFPGAVLVKDITTDSPTATYDKVGKFDAKLTVANTWGTDQYRQVITVSNLSGLESYQEAVPAIYMEQEIVNVKVVEGGMYLLNVYNSASKLVASKLQSCVSGQIINTMVPGEDGVYLVKLVKDEKLIIADKILKGISFEK